MINNNVEAVNLTNGVILFPNAIDLDWDWAIQTTASLVESEWSDMYVPGIDPETNEEIFVFYGDDNYWSDGRSDVFSKIV